MRKKKPSAKAARTELNIALLRTFRLIYGSVREHFRSVQKSCGISGSQLWILHEVEKSPAIGVSDLAVQLSIHQSTCSLLVEKLVRAGLLKRNKSKTDQRRVGLQLTAKGQRCVRRAPGPPEGVLPEAIASLSHAQARALLGNLRAVAAELDISVDEAADTPLSDL
jgi:MarR family transcriptional regulator, organic hydroperoxide resistance regulator